MARMRDQDAIFYGFLGLCSHQWKGNFIGGPSIYEYIIHYPAGSIARGSWFGFNAGAGVERAFTHFELFAEYKYRFAKTDVVFGIADVCINIGIKKKLPLKKPFEKLNSKYNWF
jgi:hypothetical protein